MQKKCFFFIDDVIWTFRDITRQQPKSLFDNPFLKVLKEAHDKFGLKTQLDVFYSTDRFYGADVFTLSDMTDKYKAEWEASSDWLKMAFHAYSEFPDYPYVNAEYDDVKNTFENIRREVYRFAGEKSFTHDTVIHWLPMSYDGCRALYDCGAKVISCTSGMRVVYTKDATLPYGHDARLLQNKKEDSMLYTRLEGKPELASSICGYNHIEDMSQYYTLESTYDEKTGLYFKRLANGIVLNCSSLSELPAQLDAQFGYEFLGIGNHEQYFYPEYYLYQPDYAKKIMLMAEKLHLEGYECIFAEDLRA